jgi:hypothetical protein
MNERERERKTKEQMSNHNEGTNETTEMYFFRAIVGDGMYINDFREYISA